MVASGDVNGDGCSDVIVGAENAAGNNGRVYVFDGTGKIVQFIPLQLTKYGNRHFNEEDIAKMRGRIVGKQVYDPFQFDAKVDTVARATITCAVIFKSLNEGQGLFKELKERDLI